MKRVTLFQSDYQIPVTFAMVEAFDRDSYSLHIESNHTTKILELSSDALESSMTLIVYLLDVSCWSTHVTSHTF